MRRYDDPIEVRKGLVAGCEAPEQFVWRGRLWVVREVVSHWMETGAWWKQPTATAASSPGADLLAEREVWRVEAGRGKDARSGWRGVFDLSFDWGGGTWRLIHSLD